MVHLRKISTTELRGNERFFYTQSGVEFWFWPFFGKMMAAPPGWSTFREKIFIWVNSVIIHSLKNIFKIPGGIHWQFFPAQMRSVLGSNQGFSNSHYMLKAYLLDLLYAYDEDAIEILEGFLKKSFANLRLNH